jgi:DNA-binding MarR family transcriptional regulator
LDKGNQTVVKAISGKQKTQGTRKGTATKGARTATSGGSKADDVAMDILRGIRRILRKTAEHSRQLSGEAGLTVPQVLCLRVIAESEDGQEVTGARVAEAIQLSAATVSRILDRLEAMQLVRRKRTSNDRRKVCLELTAQGRRRMKSLPTPLQEHFLAELKKLSPQDQRQMLASLNQIVAMMGASDLDVSPVITPGVDVKAT